LACLLVSVLSGSNGHQEFQYLLSLHISFVEIRQLLTPTVTCKGYATRSTDTDENSRQKQINSVLSEQTTS
jgi:hypothetical protein